MEQRRLLLALALSLLVLLAYQRIVVWMYGEPPREGAPAHQEAPSEEAHRTEAEPPAPLPATAPPAGAETVTVDTDVLHASFTTAGALLRSLELRHYRRSVGNDTRLLELVRDGAKPLALDLGEGRSDAQLLYRSQGGPLKLTGQDRGQISFSVERPDGSVLEKTYTFSGEGYLFDVAVRVSGPAGVSALGVVMTPMPGEEPANGTAETAVSLSGKRLIQTPVTKLPSSPESIEGAAWVGFAAQYFLAALVAGDGGTRAWMSASPERGPVVRLDSPVSGGTTHFAVYMGPKDRESLADAGHELSRALDFGWFWFIAIPLLYALRWLFEITGNYGVAIIILTALAKVATIPLTQATFRNMREMQKLQPQMQKLRERHKEDPAALQKEVMELYRRHRLNPLSGCLPMILQIPIFIGLYNALIHAIELRHAPFALWITDLSVPDRLMVAGYGIPVLTLLMGASMLLQQWLTPQQGDPTQQRIMMIMPIIFTYMFIHFPAGLVLYWLVNNIISIGQQYVMLRRA